MTIKRRFLLFFSAYIGLLIVIVAAASILVLSDTLSRVLHAENQAYAMIMGEQILQRAIIGYVLLVLLVVAISLPIGVVLARILSGAYVRIFENLTRIARDRLRLDRQLAVDDSERSLLQKYIDLLVADQEKLRDYERTKAWKDGARMLMHELKNPLTPLKLSAETLSLPGGRAVAAGSGPDSGQTARAEVSREQVPGWSTDAVQEEIRSILASTRDVEAILGVFRELVNLEFGPREEHDLRPILAEAFRQQRASHGALAVRGDLPGEGTRVLTEPTLLRMAIANLVNNGLEADPSEFRVELSETPETVTLAFITPQGRIEDPARVFHIRYSEKGPGRGYGMFLVRRIADYLDLDLDFEARAEGVTFAIRMKKVGTGGA